MQNESEIEEDAEDSWRENGDTKRNGNANDTCVER
jgi:hypothetical protein